MSKVPAARVGCDDQIDVKKLLDVQELVKKWKGKFCRLKGSPNGLANHANSHEYPKLTHFDNAKLEDAALITMFGGNSLRIT